MATDGRNAASGDAGDLRVGQSLEVAQDDGYALRRRQRGDRVSDRVDGQVPFGVLCSLVTGVADVAEQIEGFGDLRPGDPVQRPAGDDLVQPGREAGIRFEP